MLANAQECELSLSGVIKDASTGMPIDYANIYLKEMRVGTVSDSAGFFQLQNICPGHYHLAISHVGCEGRELFLDIYRDTVVSLQMDHNSQLLDEVAITGETVKTTTQELQSLNEKTISENVNQNLANMLENVLGVTTLKNGNTIAKPVVHGLYGNRLIILNNGVSQSGQQWGVDHSPEIDPLIANRITVIKGVGALEYQGNSLGSVILVEPKSIGEEPHLHGKARYFFESNGLGNGLNLQLQQNNPFVAWRLVGTLKKSGDTRTADYFLNNTGREEANIALQLEKSISPKWKADLYASSFNTNLGVLRGSHIGNLTDLEASLTREEPFFTEENFSYDIEAPFQKVNHHLLKLHSKYSINDNHWLDVTYAGQLNLRKEFDVRRSGRSDIPALSLRQLSHFVEGKYQGYFRNNWRLKTGIQVNRVDNENIPETGILPLIPDYISYELGGFALLSKQFNKLSFELGGRYDYEDQRVAAIALTGPRRIIRYNNQFQNYSATGGVTYANSDDLEFAFNIGYASRNPEVNELYSNGLHQGVSGIEAGDPDLMQENSLKATFSVKGDVNNKFFFDALFYYQAIEDFIYLNPQDEIRLTIRGAFPVFKYEQTDAEIVGLDLAATYRFTDRFNAVIKYSFIQGTDRGNDLPLINMPSNNLLGSLNYQLPQLGKLENIELQLNNRFVFEQTNLLAFQDFTDAPDAYNLVGLKIGAEQQLAKLRFNYHIRVENLLNVSYRDYLNRWRYFADDIGINLIVGVGVGF